MGQNVTQKLLADHLVRGELRPKTEVAIAIDQALLQDATGTIVMLTLEALGLDRVRTTLAVQYVDHNLMQQDSRNAEDHLFLESAAKKFGLWFSPPGNGVSHPLHMANFGKPGQTLVGSDSHTPAAGALGMLAFGAGGLDVALALAGEPYRIEMPEIWGIRLASQLPDWVSAKDAILEILRRHGVKGGLNRIIEYHGPGLENLTATDRHVIANMGTELGATSTVFPSDAEVAHYLRTCGRDEVWREILPDKDADYDVEEEIDLSSLEPLIALPSCPGNVVPVREVAGEPIYQAYIGSSANPGFRDFAVPAEMVHGKHVADGVSFDINPTSRTMLLALISEGHMSNLLRAGARLHQAGCNGCIGMGQAPASGRNSLRTVPRNFPGRSGTTEDSIFLCSPETATASALVGKITDPRDSQLPVPAIGGSPHEPLADLGMFIAPADPVDAQELALVKGDNIASLPILEELPDSLNVPVLLKTEDDISTDEIMPAGAEVLPLRSNIPKIARFVFRDVDPAYPDHADKCDGHAIIGGDNYGQGSSREHAALAPRSLGLRLVVAKSFARIHRQNLVNYGVLPLTFKNPDDCERINVGAILNLKNVRKSVSKHRAIRIDVGNESIPAILDLSNRERDALLAGGLINLYRGKRAA